LGPPKGLVLTDGPVSEDLPTAPASLAAAVGLHTLARLQQQLGEHAIGLVVVFVGMFLGLSMIWLAKVVYKP